MIIFENIKFKNINSVGNYFIEIPLNKYKNIVFVGENGTGKTTVLQAITFALYGKPFTDIKIGSLINSVNKNHLEVEIVFTKGKNAYKVRRGLKPDHFEIYCNEELIKQDAKKNDYQEILTNILGFDFKTFTKVIILGSATHMPFMQLKTAERRDLIEKLLDLEVFSVMNDFSKKDLKDVNEKIKTNDAEIYKVELNIETKQNFIDDIESNYKTKVQDYQARIADTLSIISGLETNREEYEEKLKAVDREKYSSALKELQETLSTFIKEEIILSNENNSKKKRLDFISGHNVCPICDQTLDEEYKTKIRNKTILDDLEPIKEKKTQAEENINKLQAFLDKIEKLDKAISEINSNIKIHNKEIQFFNTEIKKLDEDFGSNHSEEIDGYNKKLKSLLEEKEQLKESKTIIEIALVLLKDDGIKASIIRRYVKLINDLLREYLEKFDFFVNFTLSENFDEEFKSRHVDKFTYLNFSEGEKKRIDLALLLTLKEISRQKNNVSCNLLAFDETLERIDEHGADCFVKILRDTNTNNLIISHSDFVINKFNSGHDCVIRVFKKNKFSYYQFLNQ